MVAGKNSLITFLVIKEGDMQYKLRYDKREFRMKQYFNVLGNLKMPNEFFFFKIIEKMEFSLIY